MAKIWHNIMKLKTICHIFDNILPCVVSIKVIKQISFCRSLPRWALCLIKMKKSWNVCVIWIWTVMVVCPMLNLWWNGKSRKVSSDIFWSLLPVQIYIIFATIYLLSMCTLHYLCYTIAASVFAINIIVST